MQGKKYAFTVLIVLAAIMAVAYIATYIQSGLNNSSSFTGNALVLVVGILYAAAVLTMPNFGKIGWYVYMLALLFTIILELIHFTLGSLPLIFMTIFIMIYLLDDDVKASFGVRFTVKL